MILVIGFGILYSLLREARPPHGAAAISSFDPVSVSLSGIQLAQIAAGVLGVLLITGAYATGLIRTSLATVPRRLPILWGKAATLAAATVAVSLPTALAAFLAGQSILARQHLAVTLSQPGVARAVIGSALYLAVAGLIGLGLGTLLRSTADGIAALFGLLFAVQIVAGFLPGSWSQDVGKYLPASGRPGRDHGPPRPHVVATAVDRVRRVLPVRGDPPESRRHPDATRRCVTRSGAHGRPTPQQRRDLGIQSRRPRLGQARARPWSSTKPSSTIASLRRGFLESHRPTYISHSP